MTPLCVLYVDEEPFLESVGTYLENGTEVAEFDVRTTSLVDEAFEALERFEPDCIVSATTLPGSNPLAFLEEIRERDPHLPFLFFGGDESAAPVREAFAAGATDYVRKADAEGQYELLARRIHDATDSVRSGRLEEAVEHAADAIFVTDVDGTIEYVNAAFETVTGYAPEEAIGHTPRILNSGEQDRDYFQRMWDTILNGRVWEEEIVNERKSGERYHAHQTVAPIVDDSGQVEKFVAIQRDVTERRLLEEQVERSAATLSKLHDVTTELDLAVEEKLEQVLEIGTETLDYPVGYVTHIEDDRQEIVAAAGDHDLLQQGAADPLELTYCRRTIESADPVVIDDAATDPQWNDDPAFERFGLRCYVGARIVVDGEVYGTVCFAGEEPREAHVGQVQGSTVEALAQWIGHELERRQYERDLERREAFVANVTDAIMVLEDDYTVEYASPAAESVLGCVVGDLVTDELLTHVHPDDRPALEETLERVIREEDATMTVEYRFRCTCIGSDEEWRWVESTVRNTLANDAIEGLLVTSRDISGRKRRERELEQARSQLRQVLDLVPDLIFAKNRAGEYILANESVADVYDRSLEEIEGKTDAELLESAEQARAFREDDLDVIDSGEPKHISEEELTRPDGTTIYFETKKMPFEVAGTGETAVLGYARDVTDLKEQRDRLELLNQVVRHDVRNDMQIIKGRAQLLGEYVEEGGAEHLSEVLESADAAIELTQTARELTETMLAGSDEQKPMPLRDVLALRIDAIRSRYSNASVTVDGTCPDVAVFADEMLASVLDNLLVNAVVHNDTDAPTVTVSVDVEDDRVHVAVADDGPGIPDDRKAAVFGSGEKGIDSLGTGLGLYLVRTLVDQYGGDVRIEDNDPRGSVFTVSLRRADGAA